MVLYEKFDRFESGRQRGVGDYGWMLSLDISCKWCSGEVTSKKMKKIKLLILYCTTSGKIKICITKNEFKYFTINALLEYEWGGGYNNDLAVILQW